MANSRMMSKQNLERLKKLKKEYIIGEPINRLKEKMAEEIVKRKKDECKVLEVKERKYDGRNVY
ncbi:MAG: hypothetical protein KatS3mg035_1196 [Bacteroidia bacterium]|jgi:hypothetical protein|nr:MAG: hypothetical protein KatS3mg035_1196 [Bacteroidia bacterium]